jgi:hypothetical protein
MINTVSSPEGQDPMAEESDARTHSGTGKAKVEKADPSVASLSEQAPPPYAHSSMSNSAAPSCYTDSAVTQTISAQAQVCDRLC